MPEPRRPSSSSYAPVFINPSRPVEAGPTAVETVPHGPARVKLRYPWPLFLFSMCDLVSTGYHAYKGDIDREIIAVCLGRGIVLGLVLGLSRQWRSRGGWVALGCVISVGMAVWTVCKAQLEGGKRGDDERGHVPILFLAIVRPPTNTWKDSLTPRRPCWACWNMCVDAPDPFSSPLLTHRPSSSSSSVYPLRPTDPTHWPSAPLRTPCNAPRLSRLTRNPSPRNTNLPHRPPRATRIAANTAATPCWELPHLDPSLWVLKAERGTRTKTTSTITKGTILNRATTVRTRPPSPNHPSSTSRPRCPPRASPRPSMSVSTAWTFSLRSMGPPSLGRWERSCAGRRALGSWAAVGGVGRKSGNRTVLEGTARLGGMTVEIAVLGRVSRRRG